MRITRDELAIDRLFLGLSALSLLFLVILTVTDIVGRNLFRSPIPASYELTMLVMGVLVFSGLPFVTRQDSHLRVDIIDSVVKQRHSLALVHKLALYLFGLLGSIIIAGALAVQVYAMYRWGNRTFYFNWPLWPWLSFMWLVSVVNVILYLLLIATLLTKSKPRR